MMGKFEHRYKCGKRVSQNGDTLNLCHLELLTKDYRCAIIYNDTSSTVKIKSEA